MKFEIKPTGFECPLIECPPGFFLFEKEIGFKTEYVFDGSIEVFCGNGEYFGGGSTTHAERDLLKVIPISIETTQE